MQPRFFVDPSEIEVREGHEVVVLKGEAAHHITRVLRMQPDDPLWVCDGTGKEYPGRITELRKEAVTVALGAPQSAVGEPAFRITLFQGLPKSDKMDWIVQKAAEVGVHTVVPLRAERSVINLSDSKAIGRTERWRRIAEAAAAQAGRGRVPVVEPPTGVQEALTAWRQQAPEGLLVLPWEEERERGIRSLITAKKSTMPQEIGILIGPEGGLTADEIQFAAQLGGEVCTLGPRILRTETAGTVVAALILYELGEMGD